MGEDRKIMGRVKVPVTYRTDDRARRVTLCKRKKGLYKKAEELASLCGVEVAVVVVGEKCKPSQMVATGHGLVSDIPSCYRVLTQYTKKVTMTPLDTPAAAAVESQETLKMNERLLETQRRQIEALKRQLSETDPTSSLLVVHEQDEDSSLDEDFEEFEDEEQVLGSSRSSSRKQSTPVESIPSSASAEMPGMM